MLVGEWFYRGNRPVGGARCFHELHYARLLCVRSIEESEDCHGGKYRSEEYLIRLGFDGRIREIVGLIHLEGEFLSVQRHFRDVFGATPS